MLWHVNLWPAYACTSQSSVGWIKEGLVVTINHIEEQLKRIGCNFQFWGRPEIRELTNILLPDEIIAGAANGRYEGGFALLVVTNHRLLLIDRKIMFLTLEDIRFDMIVEMDFTMRLLNSTVLIITPNRKLIFKSWSHHRIRNILNYTQQRVMEIRQQHMQQQFQPATLAGPQAAAELVGGLAMQSAQTPMRTLPVNPYTQVPILMRRRRFPKFY